MDDARDLVGLFKSLVHDHYKHTFHIFFFLTSCRSFSPGHLTTSNIFASYFPELPLFSFFAK